MLMENRAFKDEMMDLSFSSMERMWCNEGCGARFRKFEISNGVGNLYKSEKMIFPNVIFHFWLQDLINFIAFLLFYFLKGGHKLVS